MRSVHLSNDIMEALRKGEPEALQSLLELFYGALCLFAERMVTDRQAAEDIVGEAFIKLWKRRDNFATVQNIKAFLYISTRNAALNLLKQAKRESLSKKQLAYLSEEQGAFVLNDMVRAEVLREIMQEIDKLPEQCGKVLKLGYLQGMKNQEIATMLNISVHTVKNQKARAIQLLKIRLRDRDLMALFFLYTYLDQVQEPFLPTN
jgi:RNA polymerase sigma-70 factor, Bacteroides expansion family 1